MKKSKLLILGTILLTLFWNMTIKAQEKTSPVFIVITTIHKTQPVDEAELQKIEQEYYDKVTSKNELIIGSEILHHFYTTNSAEILFINVFKTWEDIEKANAITEALVLKGWPNKEERSAFFDKKDSFYTTYHSDEILKSQPWAGQKYLKTDSEKPVLVYMRVSQLSYANQGEGQWKAIKEYNEKVTLKNPYVLGYYPSRHYWGSDSRDYMEGFMYNSLSDMEAANAKMLALIEAAWPDEKERKAFMDTMGKAFTGIHGDYVYRNEPTMRK
tara:strand:+ start:2073 stop:2885 length:813 start_codon:yes stop_codon:yes gene_type:complete